MHIKSLREAFPKCKVLYLFRDPRNTLVSLKYASGSGHDPRRYNPFIYALYWRTAVRSYFGNKTSMNNIFMIRYEDITSRPEKSYSKLNTWLGARVHNFSTASAGHNSSFQPQKRKELTQTEKWLCERICGTEMGMLGYSKVNAKVSIKDFPEILFLFCRSFLFQLLRILFSPDGRRRIGHLFKQVCQKLTISS